MLKTLFLDKNDKACTRRIMGTMGFVVCLISIFADIQHPLLEHLLYTSGALIGLTTLDARAKKEE